MATIDPASSAAALNQPASLGLQDFMKILLTQLTYQDPLKPMDNQQFMSQIAQFTTLEQSQQLNEKIDRLLAIQSATQSIGLIGKTVDVNGQAGPFSGVVTALSLSTGDPQLTVRTSDGGFVTGIALGQVVSVH
jgi:flagellar basal-body rod modification protein FlgD